VRKWLEKPTALMLEMAGLRPGNRVLDVAAGAGDQTIDIARRVGPGGFVLALDFSPAILKHAAENLAAAGLSNFATATGDGESLEGHDGAFDAAICRLGLMLFPDPLAGLAGIRRALKPGGAASVMVFGSPANTPTVTALMATALHHAGLPPRDPFAPGSLFSLGKPGLLEALFKDAGFRDVQMVRLDAPFDLPSVDDYLAFIRSSASPVLQILGLLDDAARDAAWTDIRQKLDAFSGPEGWSGPNELLVAAGRA